MDAHEHAVVTNPAQIEALFAQDEEAAGAPALPAPRAPGAETLVWHPADLSKPDADLTVLLYWLDDGEFCTGYWDGQGWIACESGGTVLGVTHWAEPQGPQAVAVQAVPEIDYLALIADCCRTTGQAQGTKGCIQFKRGAEWFRAKLLAALSATESHT